MLNSRSLRYLLGVFLAVPLSPLLYWQGKRIRAQIPDLPEAQQPSGFVVTDGIADSNLRVLLLGESTVAGVGVQTHEEGFAGAMAKNLHEITSQPVAWKVYAKSGYTAKDVHQLLVPQIQEKEVDLLVVGLGGNDAFTLNAPWRWRKELTTLVQLLKTKFPTTPIVFSNMPPIRYFPAFTDLLQFFLGNLVDVLGEELEDLTQDMDNVYYCAERITPEGWSQRHNVAGEPTDFFSDGVHPSRLTYEIWAKEVVQEVISRKILT